MATPISESSENMLFNGNRGDKHKPMSIKDRIRAMNLVAEMTSTKQLQSNPRSSHSPRGANHNSDFPACDLSTVEKKTKQERNVDGLSSDPGVGNEDLNSGQTAAAAITMWRRRKVDEKVQVHANAHNIDPVTMPVVIDSGDEVECEQEKVEQWTISDLTKGRRQGSPLIPPSQSQGDVHLHKSASVSECDNEKTNTSNVNLEHTGTAVHNSLSSKGGVHSGAATAPSPSFDSNKNTKKITHSGSGGGSGGRFSPIPTHSRGSSSHSIERNRDRGFVMPRLKPVRRAPHTLALVAAMTSPERIRTTTRSDSAGESSQHEELPLETSTSNSKHDKNAFSNGGQIGVNVNRRTAVSMSPSRTVSVSQTPTIINSRTGETVSRIAVSMSPVRTNKNMMVRNKVESNVVRRFTKRNQTYNPQHVNNDHGHGAQAQKMKCGTPKRSKISERIKAFSSVSNGGTAWKQTSPGRYPVAPPAIRNLQPHPHPSNSLMKRSGPNKFQQTAEDSSCTSNGSERHSQSNDDDSISVLTPLANGTPARLGAQPPTPNSYNSEAAYTSVASSGDGAVAGSFESNSQQSKSDQMRYSNVGTPGSSVQDENSTMSPSHNHSHNHGQIIVTQPVMKNTLQSKLEYDKQRATRRSRMIRTKQMKVPSVLVAAQKKAQDVGSKPLWGSKRVPIDTTPSRNSPPLVMYNAVTPSSLDGDPTMLDQSIDTGTISKMKDDHNKVTKDTSVDSSRSKFSTSLDEGDSTQAIDGVANVRSRSKSGERGSSLKSQMKSDVMKQLILRRRRRKEYQAGKRDQSKEMDNKANVKEESNALSALKYQASSDNADNSNTNRKKAEGYSSGKSKPDDSKFNHQVTSDKDHPPSAGNKQKRQDNELQPSTSSPATLYAINDTEQAPPLPPDIIRCSSKDGNPVIVQEGALKENKLNINFTPEASKDGPKNEPHISLSDSVSVASSILFDEYPDDGDEPEPVVDSFIDMDLSPIKSNDASKHIFDTSTSYRGSPDHLLKIRVTTPNQSPTRHRGHIRDLIESQSTPKRANRHVSLRNVGEMLYSPKGTPLEASAMLGAALPVRRTESDFLDEPFDEQLASSRASSATGTKFQLTMPEPSTLTDRPPIKDSSSTFRNHSSDAFSDVSSGIRSFRSSSTASATSSSISTISARAKRLLSERRGRTKRRSEPEICIERNHATDLARKIMSGGPSADVESDAVEKSCNVKVDRVLPYRGPIFIKNDKGDDAFQTANELRTKDRTSIDRIEGLSLGLENLRNKHGDTDNSTPEASTRTILFSDTSPSDEQTDTDTKESAISLHAKISNENTAKQNQIREHLDSHIYTNESDNNKNIHLNDNLIEVDGNNFDFERIEHDKSAIQNKSLNDSTLSDLKMDVSNLYDSRESEGHQENRCVYPIIHSCNTDNDSSWLQMDKLSEVSQGLCLGGMYTLEGLNVSNVSAVRITQQISVDEIPFDEEVAGSIEVEYIPNKSIVMTTSNERENNILMHISANSMNPEMGAHLNDMPATNAIDKQEGVLNYVSASSCDTTDESISDFPIRVYSK